MIYLFLEQQFCQNNPIIKSLGSEFEGIKRGIVQKVPKTTGRRRHMRPWRKPYFCYEGRSRVRFNTFISFYPRFSHEPDIHFKHMIVLLRSMLMKNNSNHAWQIQFYIDSTKESRVWDLRNIVCGDLSLTPILIKEKEKINWVIYFRGFKIILALERPWSNLRLILTGGFLA